MNILVSACLLGVHCRYDGSGQENPEVCRLMEGNTLIPVCPEILGGLATPREPAERRDGRVVTRAGADVTDAFCRGAEETLRHARLFHCELAVLKERSPSCGCGRIYDGTFTGTVIPGSGVAAELLTQNGIRVIGESAVERELL